MSGTVVVPRHRTRSPGVRIAVALLLVLPFGLVSVGPLQVVQAAAAAVLLGVLLLQPGSWRSSGAGARLLLPGAALLAAAALATPLSRSPEATFRADIQLVLALGVAVSIPAVLTRWSDLRLFLGVLVAVGTAIGAHALVTAGDQEAALGGDVVTGRATGIFAQPNELGSFLAALIVVAVGSVAWATSRRGRWLSLVAVLVMVAALLLSLSRGAWIGATLGVLVLAVAIPRLRRPIAAVLAGSAVVVGAALAVAEAPALQVLKARLETVTDPADNPYDNRGSIFAEAIGQLQDRPLLGQGPGAFPSVAARTSLGDQAVDAEHGHNLVLTVAAEYGLVGVAALLLLVGCLAYWTRHAVPRLLRTGRGAEAAACAALAGALTSVLGHGMVDYPLRNPVTFFTTWILVGALVAATLQARRGAGP